VGRNQDTPTNGFYNGTTKDIGKQDGGIYLMNLHQGSFEPFIFLLKFRSLFRVGPSIVYSFDLHH
jgi:hypothetical protein